jgi:sulfotransferase family protein
VDPTLDDLEFGTLRDWTPVRVRFADGEPRVEWALVGERFAEPFFEQTADRAMRHPFNQLFARRTPLGALEELDARDPGPAPAGFIFHMSRCGSTLVSQMLGALPSALVVSEAQPVDAVLTLPRHDLDEERVMRRLRAVVAALTRPRTAGQRAFVKFHAWHVVELPLILRAFPNVPWVFLFREPRAVLRSQARSPGAETVAGALDPHALGLDVTAAAAPQDEYRARILAAFCDAAVRCATMGRALFIDYAHLPDAVVSEVLPFFDLAVDADTKDRMRAVAERDAKRGNTFVPDPHRESADVERLASRWLDPAYAALRALAAAR